MQFACGLFIRRISLMSIISGERGMMRGDREREKWNGGGGIILQIHLAKLVLYKNARAGDPHRAVPGEEIDPVFFFQLIKCTK